MKVLVGGAGFLLSLLLAGNLYFIKRLVEKFHDNSDAQIKLSTQVDGVVGQLRGIREDIKELRKIELDVAVLKAQYGDLKT